MTEYLLAAITTLAGVIVFLWFHFDKKIKALEKKLDDKDKIIEKKDEIILDITKQSISASNRTATALEKIEKAFRDHNTTMEILTASDMWKGWEAIKKREANKKKDQ